MNSFPYGAVLKIQREFTPEDIRSKLEAMHACGMNFVVVWPAVFWWESKANANYPFQTGIDILKHAETLGMKVIMELAGQITALEYAPDFLMREEYYARKADGTAKRDSVVFEYLNYNHPDVKTLIRRNFTSIARAYKSYPALYGYDIWNETMFTSYDRFTLQVFRDWLRSKYGSLERLNEVWDRAYEGWEQVEYTTWLWPSVMPLVDWQQFRKANVGMILNEWRGYVKEEDPDRPTIADNINSMLATDQFYSRPHDDWNAAANVDEYGISFYPKENLAGTPAYKRWQTFVGVHSAVKSGRFWISELQSHHRNMFNPNSLVYPHELKWWTWEAISHGAKGLIYWKWDPFLKGLQTAGRGLVDAAGRPTPRAHAAEEIARVLEAHADAFTTYEPEAPRVAIVYDKLTHDFTKTFTLSVPHEAGIYLDSLAGLFECLYELNIAVKYVTPEDVIDGRADAYRALFLTNQLAVGPELAAALQRYAEQGGTVVADGKFGELREDGWLNESSPGGALNAQLGYRLIDIDPLGLDITLDSAGGEADGGEIAGFFERKLLKLENPEVEVRGRYSDGAPAVLVSPVGRGRVIYISTMLWYGYYREPKPGVLQWLRGLNEELGLSRYSVNHPELKACTLRGEDGLLLFVFNYTDAEIRSEVEWTDASVQVDSVVNVTGGNAAAVVPGQQAGSKSLPVTVSGRDVAIYRLTWRPAVKKESDAR